MSKVPPKNKNMFPKLDLGKDTMSIFSTINEKCKEIYESSEKGNNFFKTLNDNTEKIITLLESTMSIQNVTSSRNVNLNDTMVIGMGAINTSINRQTNDIIKLLSSNETNDDKKTSVENGSVFFDILKQLKLQVKILQKNATPTKKGNIKKSASKEEKTSLMDTVSGFSDSIATLSKNLTIKLIKNLDKFNASFNRLIDSSTSSKIDTFTISLEKFTKSFSRVGALTRQIGMLAIAFIILSVSVASPLTIVAVGVFTLWIKILSKVVETKNLSAGLFNFALGIGMLALSLVVMNYVEWTSPLMLLGFMYGLGYIMKQFKFDRTGSGNSMVTFALGIGILTLTLFVFEEVSWGSVFMFLGFLGGLGYIMKTFNFDRSGSGNSMMMFALGIGILTLTLFVFDEIEWTSVFKFLLFIGGLGAIMAVFKFTGVGLNNSMITFSLGLAILTLTLFVFEEVEWSSVFKFLLFMGGLGFIMKTFSFEVVGLEMILFSVGIIILVGALWLFKKLDFTGENLLMLTGVFLALGITYALIAFFAPAIGVGATAMLVLFGSLALGVLSLFIITKIKFKEDQFKLFMTCVGIIILGFALLAIPAVVGLVGALAFIPIAVATLVGGLILWAISNMTFNQSNIDNVYGFMKSVGIVIIGFGLLAIPAIIGLVGALAFIPIAVATLVGGLVLWAVSNLTFNEPNINTFMNSVGTVIAGFAWMALPAVAGLVGALLFLPIALSAYAGVLVLQKISALQVDDKKILIFGNSVTKLVEQFNELSGWDLAKTSAKALLLKPIMQTALISALALQRISGIKIDKSVIESFGTTVDLLVSTMVDTLDRNADKIEGTSENVLRLAKLMNVISSIARTVGMMANMQFNEYDVKDGKLVLTGTRKLLPTDFEKVGENITTMLDCLVAPLNKIGAGIFITPQTEKGIENIGTIVNAFKPLVDVITTYAKLPIASDEGAMRIMSNSLVLLVNTFEYVFKKLNNFKLNAVEVSIENMSDFMEIFEDSDTKDITDLNKIMGGFINMMTDDLKWKKINKNLTDLKTSLVGVSKAMNSIDLQKAMTFERITKQLTEKNTANELRNVVAELSNLLVIAKEDNANNIKIKDATVATAQVTTGNSLIPSAGANVFSTPFGNNQKPNTAVTKPKAKPVNDETRLTEMLINQIQSLISETAKISSVLSGVLKMKLVDDPRKGL